MLAPNLNPRLVSLSRTEPEPRPQCCLVRSRRTQISTADTVCSNFSENPSLSRYTELIDGCCDNGDDSNGCCCRCCQLVNPDGAWKERFLGSEQLHRRLHVCRSIELPHKFVEPRNSPRPAHAPAGAGVPTAFGAERTPTPQHLSLQLLIS